MQRVCFEKVLLSGFQTQRVESIALGIYLIIMITIFIIIAIIIIVTTMNNRQYWSKIICWYSRWYISII